MNAKLKPAERLTARDWARDFLRRADGNREKARQIAMEADLGEDVVREVLSVGWQLLLARIDIDTRERALRAVAADAPVSRAISDPEGRRHGHEAFCSAASQKIDPSARIARVAAISIFDTFKIDKKRVGDMTCDDLRAMYSADSAKAKSFEARARFAAAALKRMKPGKRIRDCWNETDFRELLKKHSI